MFTKFCVHNSYTNALESCSIVSIDLNLSCFVVNVEKSDFEPQQVGEWLGIIVNTTNMTFRVPERRILKLKRSISVILERKFSSAKQISKIAGQLSSMHLAVGPLVRLFTRHMYRAIATRVTWFGPVMLDYDTISELVFWNSHIKYFTLLSNHNK